MTGEDNNCKIHINTVKQLPIKLYYVDVYDLYEINDIIITYAYMSVT